MAREAGLHEHLRGQGHHAARGYHGRPGRASAASRPTSDRGSVHAMQIVAPLLVALAGPGGRAHGGVAKAYGVWNDAGYASGVTFVIDADGKVRAVFEGKDAIDPGGAIAACGRPSKP